MMVSGIFHVGSGMGNQLFRYVATRVLALDKGYEFSMIAPENFKGKDFMNLDMGEKFDTPHFTQYPSGKEVVDTAGDYSGISKLPLWEEKTNYYNPEFNFIEDNTIIDGEFQDERYFEYYIFMIANSWLKVERINIPDDVCLIGFRGGEFYTVPELGLPIEYFDEGIKRMKEINPNMKFEVHTDDEVLAKQFFPDYKVIHDIGINWRSMRYAKYAIIANSSFYILPRLCRHAYDLRLKEEVTIAPRYWARYNTKLWSTPQNYYKAFTYI